MSEREGKRSRGCMATSERDEEEPGRQLRAGVHGVGHRFPSAYWQEEEDGSAPGGWARTGTGRPEAPGKYLPLSGFLFINVFYFLQLVLI